MTPINGRVTDIIGRKPALYGAIMFLLVFSALCGAAKSIEMWVGWGRVREVEVEADHTQADYRARFRGCWRGKHRGHDVSVIESGTS